MMTDKPLDLDELERLSKKLTEASAKFSESAGNMLYSDRDQRIYRDRYNDAFHRLKGPLLSAALELIRLARIGQETQFAYKYKDETVEEFTSRFFSPTFEWCDD